MLLFQNLMKVLYFLLWGYSIIVFIRIILTWIPSPGLERFKSALGKWVDPYLNIFRGITWLRFGMMDFSSVVGLILLNFMVQLTGKLATAAVGSLSLGWAMAMLLSLVWGFVSFMLNILIILMVIRLFVSLLNGGSHSSWGNVDSMIYNVMARIVGLFTSRSVSFHVGLLITIASLLVLRIGGSFLMNWIYLLLSAI